MTRAERHGEAVILVCSDSDRAIRALLERFPAARDIEITGAGLEEAFLELTARRARRLLEPRRYIRFELLRTFRNRRFFVFSLGFPLVLYFLIAAPNRNEDNLGGSGLSAPLYFMVGPGGVRDDERDALGGRPDRGRAHGRLEPPAAADPAVDARLLPGQGRSRRT